MFFLFILTNISLFYFSFFLSFFLLSFLLSFLSFHFILAFVFPFFLSFLIFISFFPFHLAILSLLLFPYFHSSIFVIQRLKKKLDGNYTRVLRAILNKSWWQHPTRHQLYGHLPPITKTIQVRRTRHAGHCWRNRDELIRDVLLWTPAYGQAKAGRPARTYIQQLCEETGCSPEALKPCQR